MERGKIAIDGYGNIKIQTKCTSDIWMNEPELVDFFNIIAPTFRAAVRAIYKKGILKSGEVEKRVKRKDGFYENLYSVEILKSATTRLYDTEAKIICIVSKKGAQCIECHHKDI